MIASAYGSDIASLRYLTEFQSIPILNTINFCTR